MGSRCVCVSVCVCVCVCLCTILVPPINFQTSYPIDTKFWLHIISYLNSPTPLMPFLNFENCARGKFLINFLSYLINMRKFSNSYYASNIWLRSLKFSIQVVTTGQIPVLTKNIILDLNIVQFSYYPDNSKSGAIFMMSLSWTS